MKKLLIGAAALVVLLVAFALIVPSFIDWNEYKDEITAEVEKRTGRTLVIGGDIRLALLPAPAVVVTDLRLGNIDGAMAEDMLRLRSLAVDVALSPLLQGRIQVDRVKLVEPIIHLEVLADGRKNWEFSRTAQPAGTGDGSSPVTSPAGSDAGFAGGDGPPLSVRLDSVEIENGVVVYRDAASGTVERIEDLTATVAAESLSGPFEGEGTLTALGVRTGFEVDIGRIDRRPEIPVGVVLTPEAGKARIELRGAVADLPAAPTFAGALKAETADLARSIQGMSAGGGDLPGVLSQPADLAGAVSASASRVDVTDLSAHLGKTGATGAISAHLEGPPAISVRLAIAHLNLDAWLEASAPNPGAASGDDGDDRKAGDTPGASPSAIGRAGAKTGGAFRLPSGFSVSLAVSAEAITYRNGIIRGARLDAELAGGEITVSQVSGDLPGATHVAAFGFVTAPHGEPRFEGEVEAQAGDVRGLLRWLGVDTSGIPAGRARSVDVKSNVAAAPVTVRLSGMDLRFDASRVTGAVAASMAERPTLSADVAIDAIDLDAYLPTTGVVPGGDDESTKADQPARSASKEGGKSGLAALRSFDAKLKARVGRLIYHGTPFETVVVDGTLRDGVLNLSEASVGNVAGASGRLAGVIEPLAGKPGTRGLRFDMEVPDLDRLLRALDLPRPDPVSTVEPFALSGTVDGPFFSPTVDITLRAAGGETTLSGAVDAFPNPGFTGRIALADVEPVPVLRSLGVGYRPAGRIGPVDLAARLDADASRVQLSEIDGVIGDTSVGGALDLNLAGARPAIAADLRTGRLIIDPYLPADQRADVGPWLIPASWGGRPEPRHRPQRGVHVAAEAPHRRWSRESLDLSGLRALDADLKLAAEELVYDRLVLDDVTAVAKVAGGVLTAEPLSGLLFRGPFQADFRLDASATPRIVGALTVRDADLARLTRDARGRSVATGQMTFATEVTSRGSSTAELVAALDGSGSLRMSNVEVGKGAAGGGGASVINLLQQLNGIGAGLGASGSRAQVTASFRIEDGVVRSDDIALSSGLGDGGAEGMVDLAAWHMDVAGAVRLRGNILTGLVIETTGPPVVPFRIRGPVDDPAVNVDATALKIRRVVIPDPRDLKDLKDLDIEKGVNELRKLFGR